MTYDVSAYGGMENGMPFFGSPGIRKFVFATPKTKQDNSESACQIDFEYKFTWHDNPSRWTRPDLKRELKVHHEKDRVIAEIF